MQGRVVPRGQPRDMRSRFTDRGPDGLILGSSPRMTDVEGWRGSTLRPGGRSPLSTPGGRWESPLRRNGRNVCLRARSPCPHSTHSGPPVFPLVRTRPCSRLDTIGAADDNGHTIAQYHRIAPSFLHGLGIDRMRFMHADEAIGFQPLNDRLH